MSIIGRAVEAVTPGESQQDRTEARQKARGLGAPGGWLGEVVGHHERIEAAFAKVKSAGDAPSQRAAQKELAVLLTGHSNAEESVIYPAMSAAGQEGHASHAFKEQAMAKTEMAALEKLAPMSEEYRTKLEEIREAVAHHVYEEESTWFPALITDAPAADQAKLGERYREEFERYVGAFSGTEAGALA
jgi:hypothetical protein